MTKLDEKMKAMLAVQLPVQATTGPDGLPDIGPKRSLRVYDDTALIYNENTGGRTLKNIRAGSKMAVAVIDRENRDGYRFICTPVITEDGEAYENALNFAQNNGSSSRCVQSYCRLMRYTASDRGRTPEKRSSKS